jgi:iron-only hydrogenase group A
MGHYELPLIDDIPCISCGQCTLWCPTGAITERDDTQRLFEALDNPDLHVVVQTAPSTRIGLGEEFGLPAGTNVEGKQVAALRVLGFDTVLDTNFAADLTIMEEATELVHRLTTEGSALPMFTSCCPGWVKFCEMFYPELIPHLSTARSPMGMLGPIIKTYYAKEKGIAPEKIVSVSVMPCTAKKYECARPEMNNAGKSLDNPEIRDTDIVITTRELAKMIKQKRIKFTELQSDAQYDKALSAYSGGGAIFGVTGGVMEAAVRTAYAFVAKENPPAAILDLKPVRGLSGIKEAALEVPGFGEVRVAVVSGMANAKTVLEKVKDGSGKWHFMEFMACPGGCISGGGQPKSALPPSDAVRTPRTGALYTIDERSTVRLSHENPEIKELYAHYLEEPGSHRSHELLHAHEEDYRDRSRNLTAKK